MNTEASRKTIVSNVLLLITAMIWGAAFVAQKEGGAMGAFTFNGLRSFIGSAGLGAALCLLDRMGISRKPTSADERKTLWIGGILCGLALCAATDLQQVGIQYTSVGKSGFVTALYIVLVPILGLLLHQRTTLFNWIGVGIALVGLYFLCGVGLTGFRIGDALLLGSALMFSVQILLVSHFSPKVDGVRLSCIQFLVVGVLNLPLMFSLENPSLSAMGENWFSLIYAGLFSSGVAYTLQIIGQRYTKPSTASLLMSLESVFAVLSGWLLLHDRLTSAELFGCLLMFIAILLAQIPPKEEKSV